MGKHVCIGVIGAPHGVQGALKVQYFLEEPADLAKYALFDEQGPLELTVLKTLKPGVVIARLKGVSERAVAASFTGKKLFIERDLLPPLTNDQFYVVDLEGLEVVTTQGELVGSVHKVENFGAGFFLVIKDHAHQESTLPFSKEAVPEVLFAEGKVVINQIFLIR